MVQWGAVFSRRRPPAHDTESRERTASDFHQEDWESYDQVAEAYDRVTAERTAVPARDLVSLADIEPGQRVLDVGTGTGVAAVAAVEAVGAGGLVVGLDPSPRMIALAVPKHPEVRYVVGEALDLPLRSAAFDAAVGNFVVAQFNRYETALFDILRVLRPGGHLALSNWAASEDEFGRVWRGVAEELVGRDLFRDAVRRAAPWQSKFSDPGSFEDVLKRAGLKRVRVVQRDYRFEMSLDSYLEGMETRMIARSLQRIMGESIWERFREQVGQEFHKRFSDPIGDTRDVWFGIGRKE